MKLLDTNTIINVQSEGYQFSYSFDTVKSFMIFRLKIIRIKKLS